MSDFTDWVETMVDQYAALLPTADVQHHRQLISRGEWRVVAIGLIPGLIQDELLAPVDYPVVLEWADADKFGKASAWIARMIRARMP